MREYKEKLKLHRVFVRKDGGDIKVLYGNKEVDEIVRERDDYKHRAEVAEKAFLNYCKHTISFPEEVMKNELRKAEKELAEEKKE